jgi:putative ABC transport system permease protein
MRGFVSLLIGALPADVRRGRRRDIASTLQASVAAARRRGRLAAARAWLAEVANLLLTAISSRFASRGPDRPRRRMELHMPSIQDLRHAWRALSSRPGFTSITILTLALAIGATTAVFSVVDALLWRPLPFTDADRMVEVWTQAEPSNIANPGQTAAAFRALRDEKAIFEEVHAYDFESAVLLGGSEPDTVSVVSVTPALLARLGVSPLRGRLFTDTDGDSGAEPTVVVGESLWRSRLAADPDIVGQTIEFDGDGRYTIIGVLPSSFRFPSERTRVWKPLSMDGAKAAPRPEVVAWLQPGLTLERANEALGGLNAGLRDAGALSKTRRLHLVELRYQRSADAERTGLLVVFGAVGLVLLVACANVAGLLLAQGAARQRDVAVSAALGAGRGRLVRQFLMESLLIGLTAGAAGCLLAWLLVDGLTAVIPANMTVLKARPIVVDGRVLAFAAGLSLATVIVFGLLPAVSASRPDLVDALKTGGGRLSTSRAHRRLRAGIVVVELALALVLLTGAGLLMRSFIRLQQIEPGFDPSGLFSFALDLPEERYGSAAAVTDFMHRLEAGIGGIPGVTGVAGASSLPPNVDFQFGAVPEAEGEPEQDPGTLGIVPFSRVSPDYFATMGIRLREGRGFTQTDSVDVIVINETAARRYWGGRSPLGRRMRTGPKARWLTVIGVVPDVTQMGLRAEVESAVQLYYPFNPGATSGGGHREIALRVAALSPSLLADLKAQVWSLDPRLPVQGLAPVGDELSASIARERFFLLLMALFSTIGLAISAVGIYSVMAYAVEVRRREIGIRMALGADRRAVLRSVLGGAAALAAAGIALGLAGAAAAARVLQSLLYETPTTDPLTFASVALMLAVITLTAAWIPARRAARMDPLAVLRVE